MLGLEFSVSVFIGFAPTDSLINVVKFKRSKNHSHTYGHTIYKHTYMSSHKNTIL